MTDLLKTRCSVGHLIIDEDKITIQKLLGVGTSTLSMNQVTGVEYKLTQPDFLGLGQATITIFGTGGQVLEAHRVKLKDAKQVQQLIHELLNKAK